MEATFVIVGGGIAGVSCAETLAFLEPHEQIILISESALIKTVTNLHAITRTLINFNVEEQEGGYLNSKYSNVTVLHESLQEIDEVEHLISTSQRKIRYKYLCLCTGAAPNLIPDAQNFKEIIGIRDTDSVDHFVQQLKTCRRVVVVGNGGIASEMVFKMENMEVFWVVKDKHISATFVDAGAAEFFLSSMKSTEKKPETVPVCKRMRFKEQGDFRKSGAALGPDWYQNLVIKGASNRSSPEINIHYESEIVKVEKSHSEYPIEVCLSNNVRLPCDLVVSATGVSPRADFRSRNLFAKSGDGALLVDEFMQTSIPDIYAAGDVCSANWDLAKHWFQMKLWTQAHHMGVYAAKSMSGKFKNEVVLQDFCFEMFAHSTKLFGYKVILLGLYNGQKLVSDYEILLRTTKNHEYIKFVLQENRLQGAILIGETDLEETVENLILNQLDLSPFGDDILNPDIDIEDFFD